MVTKLKSCQLLKLSLMLIQKQAQPNNKDKVNSSPYLHINKRMQAKYKQLHWRQ